MGREVRMVPPTWQHPKEQRYGELRYRPMMDTSHTEAVRRWEQEDLPEWIEGERLWHDEGKIKTSSGVKTIAEVADEARQRRPDTPPTEFLTYEWWAGEAPSRPSRSGYMPDWPDAERTHFMMYEDTSEGTPISPAFATAEELARWLADTGASAFGSSTASYEQWLATIKRGFAVSAVITDGVMVSGVEAMS